MKRIKRGVPSSSVVQAEAAMHFFSRLKHPRPALPTSQQPAVPFDPCAGPGRTGPEFVIPYRRSLTLSGIPYAEFSEWSLACVKVDSIELSLGLDLGFEQIWRIQGISIGDLSSTMSLAPLEQLTLEFLVSQRRVLEKTSVESAEEMTSFESTTVDKEALNVARSASKTQNWHVDGSGSFSLGGMLGLSVGAGVSSSTTQSSQSSLQHITEATKKSAHSLKTLHKVEVRGVTEGFTQNRMTRIIKNPYADRTLSLNVFQLIKHFSVKTALLEIRPALTIHVGSIVFDEAFVVANAEFLRDKLIDQGLIDELPKAVSAAKPLILSGAEADSTVVAQLALRYLFDVPDIFHLAVFPGTPPGHNINNPASSFDWNIGGSEHSCFADALRNKLGRVFTSVAVLHQIYLEYRNHDTYWTNHAVQIVKTLSAGIRSAWEALATSDEGTLKNILDENDATEVFRRVPAFLAIESAMLDPLIAAADNDKTLAAGREADLYALSRLKQHLKCHRNYYIQQLLHYMAEKSAGQDITDFVSQVAGTANLSPHVREAISRTFDFSRAFIDRQDIIVPGSYPLEAQQIAGLGTNMLMTAKTDERKFSFEDVVPTVIKDLQVPCDGIHLEVAPGLCTLKDVPQQNAATISVAIHDASIDANIKS